MVVCRAPRSTPLKQYFWLGEAKKCRRWLAAFSTVSLGCSGPLLILVRLFEASYLGNMQGLISPQSWCCSGSASDTCDYDYCCWCYYPKVSLGAWRSSTGVYEVAPISWFRLGLLVFLDLLHLLQLGSSYGSSHGQWHLAPRRETDHVRHWGR